MQIEVKFLCPEIVGGLKNGIYSVADRATVKDLFDVCQKENNIRVNEKYLGLLIFLVNGKSAGWNTVLDDTGKVYVLRSVIGG